MSCRAVAPLVETFVDGELPAEKVLEVEQHLAECSGCNERAHLTHALQVSTRLAVYADARPSAAFAERLRAAMAAERERQEEEATAELARQRTGSGGKVLPWRTIVPLATAAAVSLVWAAASNDAQRGQTASAQAAQRPSRAGADMNGGVQGIDALLDEFVEHHMQPTQPELTEPALVEQLAPTVGVPVRLPSLHQYGARWEGGSVMTVPAQHDEHAASLRYRLGSHRVTLYVYNAQRFPLRARLEARVVRNMPVFVGNRRGYSIAAVENRGVGYAVATDLDDRESAELAAATVY